jgi:excisionase family DNA binding protein
VGSAQDLLAETPLTRLPLFQQSASPAVIRAAGTLVGGEDVARRKSEQAEVPEVSEAVVRRLIGSLGFPKARVDQAILCLIHGAPPALSDQVRSRVLSTKATCATLSISKTSLYRLIDDGELTPIRLSSRRIGFAAEDVDAFVSRRTAEVSDI